MKKVGILIYVDQIKKRGTRKNNYFDSSEFTGLKYIMSEIDRTKYKIEYVSVLNIKDCDFLLCTIISFMDVYNLINELQGVDKGSCKIIVGGPGVFNIRTYLKYIDIAIFRRGEGIINRVFELDGSLENVWYKEKDPKFEKEYHIGVQSKWIGEEKQVGCQQKCFFCQYSWTNKFKHINLEKGYKGGYNEFETFFRDVDWELCRKTAVTGLDCATEKGRLLINKPISQEEIINKMMQAYDIETEKRLSLKLYNIIGYSWENKETAKYQEFVEAIKSVDGKGKNKIILTIHQSHFSPMPATPMYLENVSLIDYRKIGQENFRLFQGKNFDVYIGMYSTTPSQVVETQVIERGWDSELLEKVMLSSKYKKMNVTEKIKLYKSKMFEDIVREYDISEKMPTDNIKTGYDFRSASETYKKKRGDMYGF
jgi:hypothetical protein